MTAPPTAEAAVRLDDVRFAYQGDFRLQVHELTVAAGRRVAVAGPSGAGKSTILNLAAGILTPDAGRVVTCGVDVGALSDAGRRAFRIRNVGLVFQEFELLEYLSVLDNVLLPYRIHRALRLDPIVRERALALLERVGLADRARRLPARLSVGERQRVAVARALVARPTLCLADEPTGNLDPENRDHVLDLLLEVTTDEGATLVVVTHDHEIFGRFDSVIDVRSLAAAAPAPRGDGA